MRIKILLPLLFSACAGCGTPVLYEEPKDTSASSIHIETHTPSEIYNAHVYLTTNHSPKPIFLGYLNSGVFGTVKGRNYLDTKILSGDQVTVSIYSAIQNDIGVLDVLFESTSCFLKTVRYCEVSATFTPMPFEKYTIKQDASGLPCQISISQNKSDSTLPVPKVIFAQKIFDEYSKEVLESESPSTSCVFEKNKSLDRMPEQKQEI